MVSDAESHAADDKARRELIDVRNQADALAYSVERTLHEQASKLSVEDGVRVDTAIKDVREALKGDNVEAIRRASEALQQASHAMAEQMYKQSAPGQGPSAGAGGREDGVRDGEVVDAEVVDA